MENLDQQVHVEKLGQVDHLENRDQADSLDHKANVEKPDLKDLPDLKDSKVQQASEENLDNPDRKVIGEKQVLKVNKDHKDLPGQEENLDHRASLAHLDNQAYREKEEKGEKMDYLETTADLDLVVTKVTCFPRDKAYFPIYIHGTEHTLLCKVDSFLGTTLDQMQLHLRDSLFISR